MNSAVYGIIRGKKYRNDPAMLATSEVVTQEVSAPMCSKSIPNSTTESIPYGYCHCGCGRKTAIASKTRTADGVKKGEPNRYISGHRERKRNYLPFWNADLNCYLVPLTQGKAAMIDECDYGIISSHIWYARKNGNTFYAVRNIINSTGSMSTIDMHRLILPTREGMVVDHINGNGLDNRRGNLREVTVRGNATNTHSPPRSSSGFVGVTRGSGSDKNPWVARIRHFGKLIHLGMFSSPEDAARAYDNAARSLNGKITALNFPEELPDD